MGGGNKVGGAAAGTPALDLAGRHEMFQVAGESGFGNRVDRSQERGEFSPGGLVFCAQNAKNFLQPGGVFRLIHV